LRPGEVITAVLPLVADASVYARPAPRAMCAGELGDLQRDGEGVGPELRFYLWCRFRVWAVAGP
jgi:hypothetical protein